METYLMFMVGVKQIKVYWMKNLLKVVALGLAIVNICLFKECRGITRDVNRKFYVREKIIILIPNSDICLLRPSHLVLPVLGD